MITIKTKEEIEKMRKAGEILAKIHLGIKDMIRPGITTLVAHGQVRVEIVLAGEKRGTVQ